MGGFFCFVSMGFVSDYLLCYAIAGEWFLFLLLPTVLGEESGFCFLFFVFCLFALLSFYTVMRLSLFSALGNIGIKYINCGRIS